MKSPRFDTRAAELRKIFRSSNLERVWKEKVRHSMRAQDFPDPLEYLDFHVNRVDVCRNLSSRILSGDYAPTPAIRILSEKSKGLCRQIVIPSPEDALVLQCLSDALYAEIKGKAPTKKSFFEPEDHSFSAVVPGSGYGTFWSWMNFQKELFKFSKNRPFIVVTDVANYYDSINYSHLRNTIAGISGVQECVLDMLIHVLAELLWQPDYMPRIEVGLPQMNLDAPRLLAHCFLYELDAYLETTPTGDFARFMDDIDVGVDSIPDAKNVIKNIDLVLQTRQLRLNSGKTLILSRAEADHHFRISENIEVDIIERDVELCVAGKTPAKPVRTKIQISIADGLRQGRFDGGSGDKILKRLLSLAGKVDAKISIQSIRMMVRLRPNMRSAVFKYLSKSKLTEPRVKVLQELVGSGLLVDDAAYTDMMHHLIETSVSRSAKLHERIEEIIVSIGERGFYGFHAALWGMSKFSTPDTILAFIKAKQNVWIGSQKLGRLVGSLNPIFLNTPQLE